MVVDPPLRIVVAAPDLLARAGLAALVDEPDDLSVVGRLDPFDVDSMESLTEIAPDLLLLDLGLGEFPDLDGFEELMAEDGSLRLVVLVVDAESAALAWRSGASAVLMRDRPAEVIAAALRAASLGLVVEDPELGPRGRPESVAPNMDIVQPPEPLTPREREVLQQMAEGLTNAAIAQRLGISENTVKFHINAILAKLDAGSRTEAVVRAARMGWLLL